MRFVLDTNVVSALRVPARHPAVARWAAETPMDDLFVTALTIAEIERGVCATERTDPEQGRVLRQWFSEGVLPGFAGRVLAFDLNAARVLAGYRVPEHAPYDDALIAAITQAHAMTLATRNVRHVTPLGLNVLDPWGQ